MADSRTNASGQGTFAEIGLTIDALEFAQGQCGHKQR
jgi:hypothetical protein